MRKNILLLILPLIAGILMITGCKKDSSDSSDLPEVLSIGSSYGGGIVFYLEGKKSFDGINKQHGLIAAEEDQTGYLGSGTDWNTAVSMCQNYSSGNYSDWYLPNKTELKTMYENLYVGSFNTYGLQSSRYWSSDVDASGQAWQIHFNTFYNGKEILCEKQGKGCVRAIRAF
jgi:hypothetical protein